jgi:serine/threonine protein kinase/Tfp pilus assembly protein PilF
MSDFPGRDLDPNADAARSAATVHTPGTSLLEDQNQRWQRGERATAEDYLARDPALRSDPELLLDLLYNEVRLREELGEAPELDEYRRRFPELGEMLQVQFEIHRAMQVDQVIDVLSSSAEAVEQARSEPACPTIAGYEVLGELGRGAMGVVYRARQLRLNRPVALKMILAGAHAGPRERERFETEAQAIARLQHPHIVQIHEIGEQDGLPFLCMELVQAGSLAQKMAGRPLPPRPAAQLVEMLARAVHHAHEEQIVHRDLKPANVLLARSDAQRGVPLGDPEGTDWFEPKITDFGLAKLLDGEAPASEGNGTPLTRGPVGTPPYMAPEQASGAPRADAYARAAGSGRVTDVYALGVVLYETLTGRPPFLGATVFETLQQVRTLEPVPPRRLQPQVPRDLETICLACLRKEPWRRYATALDLADDLRRFLEGRPIRQRPPAVWEPAVKWARRRPAAAAWAVAGVVALVGLLAAGLYYLDHRKEWARQAALAAYERFVERRDEALFQGTLLEAVRLTPQDRALASLSATREAAREALALAGVALDGETGPVLDPRLTPAEKDHVTGSCFELLLVLSQTLAQPVAGQTRDEARRQAAAALGLLDRAAALAPPTRAYHLRRARILERQGDRPAAEGERKQADALRPVRASDYYLTGVQQYEEGDATGATRSFRDALLLEPNHFEAQFYLAITALNNGRPREARIGLTACIGQRPRFAWTYVLRGLAYGQSGAFDEAEADFAAALDLDPDALVRYTILLNRGVLRLRQGKLADAAAELEKALQLRPEEPQAHLTMARVLERQKKIPEAIREMDTAVRLRPDLAHLYRTRAELRREGGDLEAALEDLDRALEFEPGSGPSPYRAADHIERGRVLYGKGRYQDAVQACDAALRDCPVHDEAPFLHAEAHFLRGQALLLLHRYAEAEQAFSESLRRVPAAALTLRRRGLARIQLGDIGGAVDDYTGALRLKEDAELFTERGWAYFVTDAWKLALRDFDTALRLGDKRGDAYVGRGLSRVYLGDTRGAAADAEQLLKAKGPDTPEMKHNIACLFALLLSRINAHVAGPERPAVEKRYRQHALEALREALALVPADRRSRFWLEKMCPDDALDSIRNCPEFVQLDRQMRQEASQPAGGAKKETVQPRQGSAPQAPRSSDR